mmetsp:Transcript_10536/g.19740  ORF Transcript_10536/g.19740 Transcript_10536/m.19740 type:complete len:379 (+) Transcript_10536:83-1219(+)
MCTPEKQKRHVQMGACFYRIEGAFDAARLPLCWQFHCVMPQAGGRWRSLCSCLTWIRNRSSVSELPRCRSSVMVQSHRSPLSLALAEYYRILRFLLLLKSSLAEAWTRGTRENGCLHHFAAGLVAVPVAALGSLHSWAFVSRFGGFHFIIKAFWVFAAAQLYAQLAAALLPHQPVQGSPLYSWLMALPLQCIVIPGLALHAWLASGLSIQEWLSAPYEDLPCQICQDAFIYMFIAYMVKDVFVGMTPKYWMRPLSKSSRRDSKERLCSGAFLFVYELHIPYGSCWLVNSDRELWKFSQRTLGTGLSRLCAACTEIDSVGSKPYGCDAFNRLSCCLYICCKQKAVHAPRKRNGYRGRERTSYVGHSYQRYLSAKTWLDQ